VPRLLFETMNRGRDGFRRLLVEKQTSLAVHHSLRSATATEGDHRRAAGLGFDRSDSEILFRGEQEGLGSPHVVAKHIVRLVPEEFDVRSSHGTKPRHIRPAAAWRRLAR